MTKKILTILMALALTLAATTAAFATEPGGTTPPTYTDMETVTITKNYNAANSGMNSPAETFRFTIAPASVTDAADGVTVDNMPVPAIGSVAYAAGEAGSANKAKEITVTLPTYTSVGVYTYTIRETAGTTAGVTYYGDDIRLVVTVIQAADNKLRVAAVHTEAAGAAGKSDAFANVYEAGSLSVRKAVTGNMGDREKHFDVTVTFTAPAGKTVNEAITYTEGDATRSIAASAWVNGTASATISLKHDQTVTFTNIPYGVTYTVAEADYTGEGYDAARYAFDDSNRTIDSAAEGVTITNNKGVTVDTGITLDSAPYILLLAVAAIGVAAMLRKRRHEA